MFANPVTRTDDKNAALRVLKEALRRRRLPEQSDNDLAKSRTGAEDALGNTEKQDIGRGARVGSSYLLFARRACAMQSRLN